MAFYWGTSKWKADQIERAMKNCEKLNLTLSQIDINKIFFLRVNSNFLKN